MNRSLIISLAVLMAWLMLFIADCGENSTLVTTSETNTAVRLVFTTQPSGNSAGLALETEPVVAVEDLDGNIVTDYRGLVTLAITPGTGANDAHLFGGTKVVVVNGVVEFKYLSIDKAAAGYTLTATSGSLAPATSTSFAILPGPPERLAFITQPSDSIAGSPFAVQPTVTVQDQYGNAVTGFQGSVTLSGIIVFHYPTEEGTIQTEVDPVPISGTTTIPVVNDFARFTDVAAIKSLPGCQLMATSSYLQSATSKSFDVSPAAPARLVVTVQPDGAIAGAHFETQPKVAIEDSYGNVVTSSRASVILAITRGSGTTGAVLLGTTTRVAQDAMGGLAEYTDLSIDLPGTDYTLTATSVGLTPGTSQAFDVSATSSQ
jgi:hypothetical protein